MDIERGILKALFYDYPVESVVRILQDSNMKQAKDVYTDILPLLMRWRQDTFTTTEVGLMKHWLQDEWQSSTPTVYHPFKFLRNVTKPLLRIDHLNGEKPIVRFEQLFRWKDAALYVGEDLLVTSFVADYDNKKLSSTKYEEIIQKTLLWNDILRHDNVSLNEILDRGLTDLHAHYNATSDVFHLNWISLMNSVNPNGGLDKLFNSQDVDLLAPNVGFVCSNKQMCIAAAWLRFCFFNLLLTNNEQCRREVKKSFNKACRILIDSQFCDDVVTDLTGKIQSVLPESLQTNTNGYIDYCIIPTKPLLEDKNNIHIIYQGERLLLYTFFRYYYAGNKEVRAYAHYFYLYILLKTRIRREFIQINSLVGFENFEKYQNRKGAFFPKQSPLYKHYGQIMLQTSMAAVTHGDYIEARVTPGAIKDSHTDFGHSTFGATYGELGKDVVIDHPERHIGFVAHFIKENFEKLGKETERKKNQQEGISRYEKFRGNIAKQFFKVIAAMGKNRANCDVRVVGIDAASTEMFCRPEVFGHVFRYAKLTSQLGYTYHVGEDFFDLTDGLRAIDEAILFLNLKGNDRLGHAMALGIDAENYYRIRHYTTIMSKQNLLDNCVWTYMRAKELGISISSSMEGVLEDKAMQLYNEIGYSSDWHILHYWHSMLLRGNEPKGEMKLRTGDSVIDMTLSPDWIKTERLESSRLQGADVDSTAAQLYWMYHHSKSVKENGDMMVQYKWSEEIADVVMQLQLKLQSMIAQMGIGIECCPTSNLKIGFIDRYDEHPLLTRFHPINADSSYPLLRVAVCTDDRGVFYTSLYEEYSLLALALTKKRDPVTRNRMYNYKVINDYIEELRQLSEQMRFDKY